MNTTRACRWFAIVAAGAAMFLPVALPSLAQSVASRPQASVPLDLAGYTAALERCSRQLAAGAGNSAALARLRQSLPLRWQVRADNETFTVSNAWLDSALAAAASDPASAAYLVRQARRRLDFLRRQALAMQAPPSASLSDARASLDKIFQRRDFRGLAGPGALEMWWDRITAWIARQIERLSARLHLGGITGNILAYVVIAIALLLLALWAWRTFAGVGRQAALNIPLGPALRGARFFVREALAAAERGDYREAIHCAYGAAVARLESLGAFPADRARTPRELLRLLDSRPAEKDPFGELTARFERVWYGGRRPSSADWDVTRAQLERIGCLASSTPATANS